MSDVVKLSGGNKLPATDTSVDPFLSYGGGGGITGGGPLLIYSKGEYYRGIDREEVPVGSRCVFFMPGVQTGWRKWMDNRPVEEDMALLVDRPQIPPRNSLGDTDQALWGGRDPWQESIIVEVADRFGEKYQFPLSGVGAIRAGKQLCAEFGKGRRSRPGCLPLVTLGTDSYQHASYGKIHFPVFTIVGWVDDESLEPMEDLGGGDTPPLPAALTRAAEPPPKPMASKQSVRSPRF